MNRFFTLIFSFVLCASVYSVVDATEQDNSTIVSGVRVGKLPSTAEGYVYWLFTNNNNHSVQVTYVIENYPAGVISLRAGEQKRSVSAYHEQKECRVTVRRLSETGVNQEK